MNTKKQTPTLAEVNKRLRKELLKAVTFYNIELGMTKKGSRYRAILIAKELPKN
jgi:hypothetical protein